MVINAYASLIFLQQFPSSLKGGGTTFRLHTDTLCTTGFIDNATVQELLSECAKMKNFANLHVVSLKGVCLDGGSVPYIVLPYMANGSLVSYLRKEHKNLIMKDENVQKAKNMRKTQVGLFYKITGTGG